MDRSVKQESSTRNVFEILREKKIAATLAIGVGIAALAGCAPSDAEGNTKPSSSTSAEATPDSTETTKPSVELDVTQIPESVVEYNLFDTLTEAEKALILEMDGDDLQSFRQRDTDQQRIFGQFVYANNIPVLEYRLDQTGNSSAYENIDISTPEGIIKNQNLKYLLLSSLKTRTDADGISFDTLTAQKASIILHEPSDEIAQENIDASILEMNVNTPPTPTKYIVEDSAVLETGEIIGNFRNTRNDRFFQSTFKSITFKDITGEDVTDVVEAFSVLESDPRFDKNLHD